MPRVLTEAMGELDPVIYRCTTGSAGLDWDRNYSPPGLVLSEYTMASIRSLKACW